MFFGMVYTVRALSLLEACTSSDRCQDINALCLQGQCRCRPGFFDLAGVCGQCLLFTFSS